jgi:DNA-binding GntR family transcriptional regulator
MGFSAPASLTEKIADHLGADIIAGRLAPDARIQELKVASALGVSRGSVREALLLLARRHLIQLLPRRGAVVTRLEPGAVCECSELLTELQALLFGKLARVGGFDIEPFDRSLQTMAAAVQDGDVAGALACRYSFVAAGSAALGGYHLGSVLEGLQPAGLRIAYLAAAHPEFDLRDGLRFHQALLKAVSDGELPRIRELVCAFNARECRLALARLGCGAPAGRAERCA